MFALKAVLCFFMAALLLQMHVVQGMPPWPISAALKASSLILNSISDHEFIDCRQICAQHIYYLGSHDNFLLMTSFSSL
jgi:hypothetical protein